ncbi:hypothetical protein THAOC_24944 [Thalassiosira oceanica]|uniref:Uncharacterized protein n=1 Tax=Thalassiosira oceanica TaxID=159749 RepID=K0S9A2_THAOC|nr:hypothetical protein THAOC_24944 [Thalassiosira oceanica]|eukprot:EJK55332.1 hypothetical protein THAOC_24944 [Thalassiosira oceanica]
MGARANRDLRPVFRTDPVLASTNSPDFVNYDLAADAVNPYPRRRPRRVTLPESSRRPATPGRRGTPLPEPEIVRDALPPFPAGGGSTRDPPAPSAVRRPVVLRLAKEHSEPRSRRPPCSFSLDEKAERPPCVSIQVDVFGLSAFQRRFKSLYVRPFFSCEGKVWALDDQDRSQVPDRLGKWPYREPSARGSRNGPSNCLGRSAKRAFIENLTAASVREGPSSAKRDPRRTPRSCRAARRTGRGRQNQTKSSFLESSRRALQVALDRRIQIDGARVVRAREERRQ